MFIEFMGDAAEKRGENVSVLNVSLASVRSVHILGR